MNDANESGFRASLSGASLFDLVQMECTRGTRGSVQVRSEGRLGLLYFDHGQVVHAKCGALQGEEALFEMLRWHGGEVTPIDLPRPTRETITQTWQGVLLRAVQEQDEADRMAPRSTGGEVVSFAEASRRNDTASGEFIASPGQGSGLRPAGFIDPWEEAIDTLVADDFEETEGTVNPHHRHWIEHPGVHDLASIDRVGTLTLEKGDAELVAQTGAYVTRLAALIAESLGLEPFEGLVARIGSRQLAVRTDAYETVVLEGDKSLDLTGFFEEGRS